MNLDKVIRMVGGPQDGKFQPYVTRWPMAITEEGVTIPTQKAQRIASMATIGEPTEPAYVYVKDADRGRYYHTSVLREAIAKRFLSRP